MTFSITKEQKTISQIEIYINSEGNNRWVEISSKINLFNYTNLLLETSSFKIENTNFIDSFNQIENIKGWMWEFLEKNNFYNNKFIDEVYYMTTIIIQTKLTILCDSLGLELIKD